MADHAGPSLAGGADAVWASRLWGNPVPRDGRRLRAPHENRPDRVSEVDPRTRVVHLLKGHRGCRRVRCGDEPPRLPDRPDPAGSSAERDVGEPATRWRALGKSRALIPYLTAGFPNFEESLDAIRSVANAGADFIEMGVPFSDPLADGPTIQRTTQTALAQGMTVARVLELVRKANAPVPVIIMTYLNPVLSYGVQRFAKDACAAGVAGVLLTDLPAGTDPAVEQAVTGSSLALIRLVAPTPDDARLRSALAAP